MWWMAAGVSVYPALGSSTGPLNEAPIATIKGSNTGLISPTGIALDSSGNIYVADNGGMFADPSVFVYPPLGSSTGLLNESPTATISGSNTGLSYPKGIALDSSRNIYVTDDGDARVCLSAAGEQHRAAQRGAHRHHQREQHRPEPPSGGIALDSSGNIYVVNQYGPAGVFVFPALGSSTGPLDEAPSPPSAGATPA